VRAFDPWPVAFVILDGAPLRIWKTRVEAAVEQARAGRILRVEREELAVCCGRGTVLVVQEVQPAGKARMSAAAFARGKRLGPGDFLGQMAPARP
jgi:methionyl-tRNA formyltransferase